MTIADPTYYSTGDDDGDFELSWSVRRVLNTTEPLFRWVGSVDLTWDAEDREPSEVAGGRLVGYFAPIAAYGSSTWYDFENESSA